MNGPLTAPSGSNGVYSTAQPVPLAVMGQRTTGSMLSSPRRRRLTALRQQSRRRARSTEPPARPLGNALSLTFSEPVQSLTVGFSLAPTSGGAAVDGGAHLQETTNTATFTPSSALTAGTAYTATVSTAQDAAGNALVSPVTFAFTTATASTGSCPCSLWFLDATVPSIPAASDSGNVELGVWKWRSDVAGTVTGARF